MFCDRWKIVNDVGLRHPFNMVVAGPSQSGKTHWVKSLVTRKPSMITPEIEKILFYYSEWQPLYDTITDIAEFHQGLPTSLPDGSKRTLIILDDLMVESSGNKDITLLFTRGTHHKNCSVILITQNFFEKGLRTITLNSHYLVILKSKRTLSQISALARQLYSKKIGFLEEAYEDVTKEPGRGYLFLDLKPDTERDLSVFGNIFAENGTPTILYSQ